MPKIARSIAKNTLAQIIGKIISAGLGLVITVILTRYLGLEGYGQYTFVLVFVSLFGVIGDWGLNLITVREASKNLGEAGSLIGNVLVIRMFLAAAAAILSIVAVNITGYNQDVRLWVAIASIYLLAISLKTSFQIVFNIKLKMENWAVSEVAANLTALIFIVMLVGLNAGLTEILWAFNVGHLVAALIAGGLAYRLLPLNLKLITLNSKYLLIESFPMGALMVLFTVYNRIDTLILNYYHGSAAVAIYGAAYKIFDILVLGAAYFANSVLPVISNLAVKNRAELKKVFQRSFLVLLVMGLGVAGGNFIFAPLGIKIIGGEEFAASVEPLRILSLALIVSYFNHLGGFTLIAMGKQWWSFGVAVIALAVNIILNLWLIPIYSYNAAAFTTFLTEGLIVIISYVLIRHELKDLH